MVFTISYLRHGIGESAATDRGAVLRAPVAQLDLGAHRNQQPPLGLNVAHLRNVFERDFVFGENGSGHAGQREFFAPDTRIVPTSGLPPRMTNLSMKIT